MAGGSRSFNRQPTTSSSSRWRETAHSAHASHVCHLSVLYRSPRWSPDDRLLAFQRDSLAFTNCLEIVPAGGGEPREVARSAWLNGLRMAAGWLRPRLQLLAWEHPALSANIQSANGRPCMAGMIDN